jgi:hypothetical protein
MVFCANAVKFKSSKVTATSCFIFYFILVQIKTILLLFVSVVKKQYTLPPSFIFHFLRIFSTVSGKFLVVMFAFYFLKSFHLNFTVGMESNLKDRPEMELVFFDVYK